jgi:hypothetical protein
VSSGRENARRNQPGAVATTGETSFDVISASLAQIGGRPDPCGEARFRSDRRRCGDRSSPRLTVPTAPSGKTYITGGPARQQRPYPRMSRSKGRFHPRISHDCGRNVDAWRRYVCYGSHRRCPSAATGQSHVSATAHLAKSSIRKGLAQVGGATSADRGPSTESPSVDSAGTARPRVASAAEPPLRLR